MSQHWLFNTLIYFPGPSIPLWAHRGSAAHGSAQNIENMFGSRTDANSKAAVPLGVPALNSRVDWANVEDKFLRGEVVVVDEFLSPWAVEAVYRFCLEATLYFDYKPGYLGAYLEDGFMSDVLHQITQEMREAMPNIISDQPLVNFWSYKYSNDVSEQIAVTADGRSNGRTSGIRLHSDAAKVNLNLWVTPDDANLDPSTGGLTIWDYAVSTQEQFEHFQEHTAQKELEQKIREAGARATHVPHRRNRVVMFDSNLVHESMAISFRPGYESRRINLTWLFGVASFYQKSASAATH